MDKKSNDYNLLKRIKEKEQQAFDEFYQKNEPLVYSLLKKYLHKTKDYEELVMSAKYGLVLAIYNFDLNYDVMFSTYAVPIILGEIKKHFKNANLLKISRKYHELNKKVSMANAELHAILNRSPTIEEISEYLNEEQEDIIEAISSNNQMNYLDETISEDTSKIELLKDDSMPIIDQLELKMALETLNRKERLIVELRYFDGLTQKEVSERLNISQVQVSRIESKILSQLKELMI